MSASRRKDTGRPGNGGKYDHAVGGRSTASLSGPAPESAPTCHCADPEHDACWDVAPNPDCSCCQDTLTATDDAPYADVVSETDQTRPSIEPGERATFNLFGQHLDGTVERYWDETDEAGTVTWAHVRLNAERVIGGVGPARDVVDVDAKILRPSTGAGRGEVVARYNFPEQAANAAIARTAATGITHYAHHDDATDTHIVTTTGKPISQEEAIRRVRAVTGFRIEGDPMGETTQRAWRAAREKAKRIDEERGDTLATDIVQQAAEALDLPRWAVKPPTGWGSYDADERWPGAYEAYARREGDLQMRITPGNSETYLAPGFHWTLDSALGSGPSMSGQADTLEQAAHEAAEAGEYITSGRYEYDNLLGEDVFDDER